MKPNRYVILTTLLLSACGGNPWVKTPGVVTPVVDPTGGITTDGGLPPGTTTPTPATGITRYEPKGTDTTDGDSGNGYVTKVKYNSGDDSFSVDNLAFDGDNNFLRATPGSLPSTPNTNFALFDAKETVKDEVTGADITQLQHRAIYGVSADGLVSFAIVRTGNYVDYGFGGFIYTREGGVTLPTEGTGTANYRGQAHFAGKAGGLRDFKGQGGMEMSTADMSMDIDFDDFNDGNGVKGLLKNRKVYSLDGLTELTPDIIAALNTKNGTNINALPELRFVIGPGVMNDNGEIVGLIRSSEQTSTGLEVFESGKYYALISGAAAAQKVVGVLVVEGEDPRWEGVTTRETDGFILVRQ